MRITSFFLLCILSISASAQEKRDSLVYFKYWIQFSDKENNPFSLGQPGAFLSQQSLDRRARQNISIDESDLPVTPAYIDSVANTGAKLLIRSKWLNGVVVQTEDAAVLNHIQSFQFVSGIEPVAAFAIAGISDTSGIESIPLILSPVLTKNHLFDEEMYGSSFNQINMMNGEYLHELGFRGDGLTIAVMDAGFYKVDSLAPFDSLWINERILGYKDFVSGVDDSVFVKSTHGMSVLSTMGANIPGEIVGTAPAADYWLIRTEDAPTEFRIEEYNWAAGAEFADSAGVDLINSSLGYSGFDDPAMNYTYSDMNGSVAVVTRAADMAALKGILVVTSAGNQGNSPWRYITAPADAPNVMAVGAVDAAGAVTTFSSRGPSYDGRVKPNIAAQGRDVTTVNSSGSLSAGNGTSFAAPIAAGLVACLWQAFPDKTSIEIISEVEKSATHATSPNDSYGFGIPDFRLAFLKMQEEKGSPYERPRLPLAYPNPFYDRVSVMLFADKADNYVVEIFDVFGRSIIKGEQYLGEQRFHEFEFTDLSTLQRGAYLIRAGRKGELRVVRVVKM